MALFAATLASSVAAMVFVTGGIQYVYSHMMYIPVIVTAIAFGAFGGLAGGVVGGILLGPLMPIDVTTGEMQSTVNWIFRMTAFTGIGVMLGAFSDSIRRKVRQVRWLTTHDYATGLPNLMALEEQLKHIPHEKGHILVALVMPTNLNELRASLGPATGSRLLKLLADRIVVKLGAEWQHEVYHIEPDIVGVVFRLRTSKEKYNAITKLITFLEQPFPTKGISIHLDCVTGTAAGAIGPRAATLIRKAYMALMSGHMRNRGLTEYSSGMETTARQSINILGNLKSAIDANQLRLMYQPKIELKSKRLIGAEALLRWKHPKFGEIPPGEFIPRAEQTELINLVTKWVLEKSLAFLQQISTSDFVLAINISIRNLYAQSFQRDVASLLKRYSVDPQRIEFEITESAVMDDPETALRIITQLVEQGIEVSIDDFGTGHSSLAYLHKMPAQAIKIDQAFIGHLMQQSHSMVITNTCITMAHQLGKKVVAEGIENEETLAYLSSRNCEMGQGYHISKPIDESTIIEWIDRAAS